MFLIKLVLKLVNFRVAHFLYITTACKVNYAVSVWYVPELSSYSFLNVYIFLSLCFIIKVRTKNFLAASCVVAMACTDYKQEEVLVFFSS
jgi:hypothetical protein